MERHGGAAPQQVVLRRRADARRLDRVPGNLRIRGPDLEAEGERSPGDRLADAAEADDAEPSPGNRENWAGGVIAPPARPN